MAFAKLMASIHHLEDFENILVRHMFQEDVRGAVNEDAARGPELERLQQTVPPEREIEVVWKSGGAAFVLSDLFGVAELTAGRDFGASTPGIPSAVSSAY